MKKDLFSFKTDEINWSSGFRIVVALFLSLLLMSLLGLTQYWTSVAFGVIFVGVSDLTSLNEPISFRIKRLAIITFAGALLTALGLIFGLNFGLAVVSTFAITLLLGAFVVWGKAAAYAAYLLTIWFVASLSFQGGTAQAVPQALAWLIGGMLYIILAIVRFKHKPSLAESKHETATIQSPKNLIEMYLSSFKFSSKQFKFIFIKALAITLGTAIGLALGLPYAHWIPVYTLVVLQADIGQTYHVFIQRLVGTIFAATLAALIIFGVHNQYLMVLIIMLCAFFAIALRGASMLLYIIFSTVVILLMLDLPTPGNLIDVWARILDVFIGALIAVVVVFLFMKPPQKEQIKTVSLSGV